VARRLSERRPAQIDAPVPTQRLDQRDSLSGKTLPGVR